MERTERRTVQLKFTEAEFLRAVLNDNPDVDPRVTVTGVDIESVKNEYSRTFLGDKQVTVRLVGPSPAPAEDREVSVISESLHQKLRKLTDADGRPVFYPGLLAGGPDFLCGEPVETAGRQGK